MKYPAPFHHREPTISLMRIYWTNKINIRELEKCANNQVNTRGRERERERERRMNKAVDWHFRHKRRRARRRVRDWIGLRRERICGVEIQGHMLVGLTAL